MSNFVELKQSSATVLKPEDFGDQDIETSNSANTEQRSYLIGLLNFTGNVITHAATKTTGDWSKPFVVGSIGNNCPSGNHDQCVAEKKYVVLFTVYCNSPSFDLFVGWRSGANGEDLTGGVYAGVTPNCNVNGVICDFT